MTISAIPNALNPSAVRSARFAMLHSLCSAQPGGFYPSVTSGETYTSTWVLAMAYAYQQTGNALYKTDCLNAYNYIKTWADANNVLICPADTSVVFRDRVFRTIWHIASAARLLRQAGDLADAAAMIVSCDAWATGFLTKVNSGSPFTTITRNGWDASNATGAPAWSASTLAVRGQRVRPATANGFVYEAQNNGKTATTQPTFPTTVGSTVTDKDVTWKCVLSNKSWVASTAYTLGQIVVPTTVTGFSYRCITAGTSSGSEPTWPTGQQATITDGTVTWRCVATAQQCSFATYTNNGTAYPSVGSATYDANQLLEEAAAFAILSTDPASGFNSGASLTTANARIAAVTALAQAFQVTDGKIPIGDPISPTDGRPMFDTEYASYSMEMLAMIYALAPGQCHADTTLVLSKALDWFDANYNTEPLVGVYYGGASANPPNPVIAGDLDGRLVTYALLGRSASVQLLPYTGAFSQITDDKMGSYYAPGPGQPLADAHQELGLEVESLQQAVAFAPAAVIDTSFLLAA